MICRLCAIWLGLCVAGTWLAGSAWAQGTAFTYQGQLDSGGVPVNGSYDLAFTLYNANVAGAVMAGPVTNQAVAVTNGLFTTTVDFGPGIFTASGTNHWISISVSTNAANQFVALLPRQQITPVPYAMYATSAGTANSAVSAVSATAAASFSGGLAGDVSGTQAATVVTAVGGQTAASVASGSVAANAATSANTAGAIVKRDAAGNFSAGNIAAQAFTLGGVTQTNWPGGSGFATNLVFLVDGRSTNDYYITNVPGMTGFGDASYYGHYHFLYLTNSTNWFYYQTPQTNETVYENDNGRFMIGNGATNAAGLPVDIYQGYVTLQATPQLDPETATYSHAVYLEGTGPLPQGTNQWFDTNIVYYNGVYSLAGDIGSSTGARSTGVYDLTVSNSLTVQQQVTETDPSNVYDGTLTGTAYNLNGVAVISNAVPAVGSSYLPPVDPDWNSAGAPDGPSIFLATWPTFFSLGQLTNILAYTRSVGMFMDGVSVDIVYISYTNQIYGGCVTNNYGVYCPGGLTNLVAQIHNYGVKANLPLERYDWGGLYGYDQNRLTNNEYDFTDVTNLANDVTAIYNAGADGIDIDHFSVAGAPNQTYDAAIWQREFAWAQILFNTIQVLHSSTNLFSNPGSPFSQRPFGILYIAFSPADYTMNVANTLSFADNFLNGNGSPLLTGMGAEEQYESWVNMWTPYAAYVRPGHTPFGFDFDTGMDATTATNTFNMFAMFSATMGITSLGGNMGQSGTPTNVVNILTNAMLVKTIYKDPLVRFASPVTVSNVPPAGGNLTSGGTQLFKVYQKQLTGTGRYAVMFWNQTTNGYTDALLPSAIDPSLAGCQIRLTEPYSQTVWTNTYGALVISNAPLATRMFLLEAEHGDGSTLTNINIASLTGGTVLTNGQAGNVTFGSTVTLTNGGNFIFSTNNGPTVGIYNSSLIANAKLDAGANNTACTLFFTTGSSTQVETNLMHLHWGGTSNGTNALHVVFSMVGLTNVIAGSWPEFDISGVTSNGWDVSTIGTAPTANTAYAMTFLVIP